MNDIQRYTMEGHIDVESPMDIDQHLSNTKAYDAYDENGNTTMKHHVVCSLEMELKTE
jgi:hypothetical protein